MIRMTAYTLAAIGVTMLVAGGDFTPNELTAIKAAHADSPRPSMVLRIAAPQPKQQEALLAAYAPMPLVGPAPQVTRAGSDTDFRTGLARVSPEKMAAAVSAQVAAAAPAEAQPAAEAQFALGMQTASVQDLPQTPQIDEAAQVRITGNHVNVRSGPSTRFDVLGQVMEGDIALLTGEREGNWVKIRIEGAGVEGFMSANFVTPAQG